MLRVHLIKSAPTADKPSDPPAATPPAKPPQEISEGEKQRRAFAQGMGRPNMSGSNWVQSWGGKR